MWYLTFSGIKARDVMCTTRVRSKVERSRACAPLTKTPVWDSGFFAYALFMPKTPNVMGFSGSVNGTTKNPGFLDFGFCQCKWAYWLYYENTIIVFNLSWASVTNCGVFQSVCILPVDPAWLTSKTFPPNYWKSIDEWEYLQSKSSTQLLFQKNNKFIGNCAKIGNGRNTDWSCFKISLSSHFVALWKAGFYLDLLLCAQLWKIWLLAWEMEWMCWMPSRTMGMHAFHCASFCQAHVCEFLTPISNISPIYHFSSVQFGLFVLFVEILYQARFLSLDNHILQIYLQC